MLIFGLQIFINMTIILYLAVKEVHVTSDSNGKQASSE